MLVDEGARGYEPKVVQRIGNSFPGGRYDYQRVWITHAAIPGELGFDRNPVVDN